MGKKPQKKIVHKGLEKKKGESGTAASYITRNQAIKKLQITLKDFRRLCILKGIYPRNPKKKKYGKDKTYYHVKDIQFLMHEPLLAKFRELKTFLKKYNRAKIRQEESRMTVLEKHQPKFILDHLVKERYPSFSDALRDLDDPLSMIFLFAQLPTKLRREHTPEMSEECTTLATHFLNYVWRTNALRSVFVSIKGTYYRAEIQNTEITWLVPHPFTLPLPDDVDYRVMLTFLEFYLTLARFTLFKLYVDAGMHYPPNIDVLQAARRAGLLAVESLPATIIANNNNNNNNNTDDNNNNTKTNNNKLLTSVGKSDKKNKELQKQVNAVVASLGSAGSESEGAEKVKAEGDEEDGEGEGQTSLIGISAADDQQRTIQLLFKDCTFLLAREVPQDSLEFVILSAGGRVIRENSLEPDLVRSKGITHQVCDRLSVVHRVLSREYVQPQWVYDSFNVRALLPTQPYAPGVRPPPHLSPFVDDEKQGYIPKQREVLQQWVAEAKGLPAPKRKAPEEPSLEAGEEKAGEGEGEAEGREAAEGGAEAEAEEKEEEEEDSADEGDQADRATERQYQKELQQEAGGIPYSAAVQDSNPAAKKKKKNPVDEAERDKQLAIMMMGKKDKRLYQRMQYGLRKKQEVADNLAKKRVALESAERQSKQQKKKSS